MAAQAGVRPKEEWAMGLLVTSGQDFEVKDHENIKQRREWKNET
jgi:hypothetical protein